MNAHWFTDEANNYITTVQLGDGPNAIDVPVYAHHYETVREQLIEAQDCVDEADVKEPDPSRVHELACELAVVEYDEARSVRGYD